MPISKPDLKNRLLQTIVESSNNGKDIVPIGVNPDDSAVLDTADVLRELLHEGFIVEHKDQGYLPTSEGVEHSNKIKRIGFTNGIIMLAKMKNESLSEGTYGINASPLTLSYQDLDMFPQVQKELQAIIEDNSNRISQGPGDTIIVIP